MHQNTNNVLYSWKMVLDFALGGVLKHMHTFRVNDIVLASMRMYFCESVFVHTELFHCKLLKANYCMFVVYLNSGYISAKQLPS